MCSVSLSLPSHPSAGLGLTCFTRAGAHLDSIALFPFAKAPGADDDGSAVTVLVTAFAALLKTGFNPTAHPLEFHFYAAEEGGLLGSKAVARDYAEKGKAIHGLLHVSAHSHTILQPPP